MENLLPFVMFFIGTVALSSVFAFQVERVLAAWRAVDAVALPTSSTHDDVAAGQQAAA